MKPDLVGVLEAAYRVEQDDIAWLSGVLAAATDGLDQGMGCSAFFYDASQTDKLRLWSFVGSSAPRDTAIMRAIERSSPERVAWVFRTQACRTASEGPDWAHQPAARLFRTWGIADVLFVNGLDPSGIGCFLTAKLPVERAIRKRESSTWSRMAAHLGSAYRLKRRLAGTGAMRGAAAVLTPSGKVEHAEGDAATIAARERLRDAVTALDRARTSARRCDAHAAIESWRVLVAARWSLVEAFESDGRRYLVARVNEPGVSEAAPLTKREHEVSSYACMGHHSKFIAYELGLAPSTVRVLLSRAAAKLGATSRAEFVARYERLVAASMTK